MINFNMNAGPSLGGECEIASVITQFTTDHMDLFRQRSDELSQQFESNGDFGIQDVDRNFHNDVVLDKISPRALLTVGKLVKVSEALISGDTLGDSIIQWGDPDPKFSIEGIPVEIRKGEDDWVEIVVRRLRGETVSLIIEIEMTEAHFNILTYAIEMGLENNDDEDLGQPKLAIEGLNLIYQDDKLALGPLSWVTAISQDQRGNSVTVSQ